MTTKEKPAKPTAKGAKTAKAPPVKEEPKPVRLTTGIRGGEAPRPFKRKGSKPGRWGAEAIYKPEYDTIARQLCRGGATNAEVAEALSTWSGTIQRWRNAHPSFRKAMDEGRALSNERVVRSLYRRAVGYEFETEKIGFYEGKAIHAKTKEHVPADIKAITLWLTNRMPQEWSVKREITGAGGTPLIPTSESDLLNAARLLAYRMQRARDIEQQQQKMITLEAVEVTNE